MHALTTDQRNIAFLAALDAMTDRALGMAHGGAPSAELLPEREREWYRHGYVDALVAAYERGTFVDAEAAAEDAIRALLQPAGMA